MNAAGWGVIKKMNTDTRIFNLITEPTSCEKLGFTKLQQFKQYKNNKDRKKIIQSISSLIKQFYMENTENYNISFNDLFYVILPDENYTYLTYENYLRLYYQTFITINNKNNKPVKL